MRVITAVEKYERQPGDITCFLAGGITDCAEWQDEVINLLSKMNLPRLVILNPRRKNFPIHDPNASNEQITWEYNMLNQMDIFSMYFSYSEKSVQPICMYELGRHLERMKYRFPDSYLHRIIVSSESTYSRLQDVEIQTRLAVGSDIVDKDATPQKHAQAIADAYNALASNKTALKLSEEQTLLGIETNLDKKFLKFYTAKYKTKGIDRDYFFVSRHNMKDLAILNKNIKPAAVEMFTYYIDEKTKELMVIMIEEFRSAAGKYVYSFPAGLIEPNEDINTAITREVSEEIGGTIKQINLIQNYPMLLCAGITDEANYLATVEISKLEQQHLEETEDINVKIFKMKDLMAKIENNELPLTVSGYLGIFAIFHKYMSI